MMRLILHVDMDAFFAAVEMRANPALRGRPLAVAGPGERTIITTASYEARKFGVRTGMALNQARRLCRDLEVVRADHRKYSTASSRVMEILGTFTPDLEQFSVDEAFLDVTGLERDLPGAARRAGRLREAVREGTGLTCSVGVAVSRVLAKLASGMNKPDGLTVLDPAAAAAVLDRTPVEKLCGIGPQTTRILNGMGVRSCGQLSRMPEDLLQGRFGKYGLSLARMARGEDAPIAPQTGGGDHRVKSVGHSATFARDITDPEEVRRLVFTLSEMVGRRARRHGYSGRRVTLTVRYDDFTTFSRQTTCAGPVSNTADIYRAVLSILKGLILRRPVRLLGVSLGQLVTGPVTSPLLPEDRRSDQLQDALDRVNDRFGSFSVGYADTVPDLRVNRIISPAWRVRGVRNSADE